MEHAKIVGMLAPCASKALHLCLQSHHAPSGHFQACLHLTCRACAVRHFWYDL